MSKLLRVRGTIDLSQFWPDGESDADTTKVVVDVAGGAFEVSDNGRRFVRTNIFGTAQVRGRYGKVPAVKNGKLTIRLQGIDAPELHYRPAPLDKKTEPVSDAKREAFRAVNKQYRQLFGETATVTLRAYLKSLVSGGTLPCRVETRIDKPNDVFDTFGRFVGNVIVRDGRRDVDLNLWLVEQGMAFPGFYASMQDDEICAFLSAYRNAKKTKATTLGNYTNKMGYFDPKVVKRKKGSPIDAKADRGDVILPKLFRRQTSWWARKEAKVYAKSFLEYLKSKERSDVFFLTDDVLRQGASSAPVQFWSDHFQGVGTFKLGPQQIVFQESASTLLDANGKPVTRF